MGISKENSVEKIGFLRACFPTYTELEASQRPADVMRYTNNVRGLEVKVY
jgi:hypothetical protein